MMKRIILASAAAMAVVAGTATIDLPLPKSVSARLAAPAQCGPYFLYWHPDSGTAARKGARRYRIVSVSMTAPDATVEMTDQLWGFGIGRYRQRPVLRHAESLRRSDLRPVRFEEIDPGERVGDYACAPYRPGELQCRNSAPWCAPVA